MANKMIIAVEFDGTLVEHKFPEIGRDLGGAYWLGTLKGMGAELVLWTCRAGASLKEMEAWLETYGLGDTFSGINSKPLNAGFDTDPRKIFANVYVDDRALGAPLKNDPRTDDAPYFDWEVAGPRLIKMVEAYNKLQEKNDAR